VAAGCLVEKTNSFIVGYNRLFPTVFGRADKKLRQWEGAGVDSHVCIILQAMVLCFLTFLCVLLSVL